MYNEYQLEVCMLAKERQNEIVNEVNIKGSVLVKELAEKYQVTEDSIRKDLSLLQKKGLLKKTYGGAMKIRNKINANELAAGSRIGQHSEAKRTIAQKAYSLLEDGDMIFLDLSTTNIELAKLIIQQDKNVTVVTNMIEIILLYSGSKNRQVIGIGGNLNHPGDAFSGSLTNRLLDTFHFDKCFMGLEGVDLTNNCVYNSYVQDGLTKKAVMKNSEKAYMLLETRKLDMQGNYKYAALDDFQGVVAECDLDEKSKAAFETRNVEVI